MPLSLGARQSTAMPELPALMRVSILSFAAEAAAREGRAAPAEEEEEEGPASPRRAFFLPAPGAVAGVAASLPARFVRARPPAAASSSSACFLAPALSGCASQ